MLKSFKNRVQRLHQQEDGQIAIIVALALIPILTMAGLAVDFQRTTTYKTKVQYAMDAALIAGSKAKQAGKTNEEITELIETYLEAVLLASDGNTTYCATAIVEVPENS